MFNRMEIHVVGSLFNSGVFFYLTRFEAWQFFTNRPLTGWYDFFIVFVMVFVFMGALFHVLSGDAFPPLGAEFHIPPLDIEDGRISIRRWLKLEFIIVYLPCKLVLMIISFIVKCVKCVISYLEKPVCDGER